MLEGSPLAWGVQSERWDAAGLPRDVQSECGRAAGWLGAFKVNDGTQVPSLRNALRLEQATGIPVETRVAEAEPEPAS